MPLGPPTRPALCSSGVPLLVYANKQDLPSALSTAELSRQLGLHDVTDRPVHVQGATATTGEGLSTGMDWVVSEVRQFRPKAPS